MRLYRCRTDSWHRARNDLDHLMINKRIGAYAGFDPTAASLHVGHLLPLMTLFWLYIHGFHSVSLVSLFPSLSLELQTLTATAGWCHLQNWGSHRSPLNSSPGQVICPKGKHGEHASPAKKALGERRTARSKIWLYTGVGLAQGACQQQRMVEQTLHGGVP